MANDRQIFQKRQSGGIVGPHQSTTNFEPYTCSGHMDTQRCLNVDGYSSHIAWRVVKYTLDHNIHMIPLPSKSIHLHQPLEVHAIDCIVDAWKAARIHLDQRRHQPRSGASVDTPAQIHELSHWIEHTIRLKLDLAEKGIVCQLIDLTMEKVYKPPRYSSPSYYFE